MSENSVTPITPAIIVADAEALEAAVSQLTDDQAALASATSAALSANVSLTQAQMVVAADVGTVNDALAKLQADVAALEAQ